MPLPAALLVVLAAYFVGTFPSAHLAGRWRGVDPTTAGSRNPGTTNVLRTAGRRAAGLTLLGDLVKGAVPAGVGYALDGRGLGLACGVAAVIGHVAPVTRRFHGGKGVATAFGMMVVVFPVAALAAAGAFVGAFLVTRIAAVASLLGSLVGSVVAVVMGVSFGELAGLLLCAAVIFVRHGENLRRLARGQERRTSQLRRDQQAAAEG